MNILAIDTGTENLSVALESNGKRSFILEKVGNRHTEFALDKIANLLNQHNLKVTDLDLIAYNQGPGSFTGLRIGLSLSLGIALGLDIKLVAIPSFAIFANALKQKFNISGNVLVGLDARLSQLYLAGINVDTLEYFLNPEVVDPGKINYVDNVIPFGSGFKTYLDLLQPELRTVVENSKYQLDEYPNALNLLDLANKYPAINIEDADLLYLRDKIALNIEEQARHRSSLI